MVRLPCGVIAVGIAVWTLVPAGFAAGGEGADRPAITIEASPAILPEGRACRLTLRPEPVGTNRVAEVEYIGTIVRADDDGLSLAVTEERRVVEPKDRILKDVSVLSRLFRNVGIARTDPGAERVVWIPAPSIQSVRLLESQP